MDGHMRSKSERQSSQMSAIEAPISVAENQRRKAQVISRVRSFGLSKLAMGSHPRSSEHEISLSWIPLRVVILDITSAKDCNARQIHRPAAELFYRVVL